MTIGRIIEGKAYGVVSCDTGATVEQAAKLLAEHRIGALPVFENERIAGIFSERDLLYCIAKEGSTVLTRRVGEVMTAPAITVGPETGVLEALALMTKRRIRHLPVVHGDKVTGFVSIGDLVKHRLELVEAEAEQMRQYIQTA